MGETVGIGGADDEYPEGVANEISVENSATHKKEPLRPITSHYCIWEVFVYPNMFTKGKKPASRFKKLVFPLPLSPSSK